MVDIFFVSTMYYYVTKTHTLDCMHFEPMIRRIING